MLDFVVLLADGRKVIAPCAVDPYAVDSDDARESVVPYRLGPDAVDSDDGREAINAVKLRSNILFFC